MIAILRKMIQGTLIAFIAKLQEMNQQPKEPCMQLSDSFFDYYKSFGMESYMSKYVEIKNETENFDSKSKRFGCLGNNICKIEIKK